MERRVRVLGSHVYSFDDFVRDVEWRVRRLGRTVEDPDFTWPGVLILDVAGGLSAEAFVIGATAEEREILIDELLVVIGVSQARRFAWVMPCLREVNGVNVECLLLIVAERGRTTAVLGDIRREGGRAPRLGPFMRGPFGGGARRVAGRFIEPLLAALD
jgi:hypothetical protein